MFKLENLKMNLFGLLKHNIHAIPITRSNLFKTFYVPKLLISALMKSFYNVAANETDVAIATSGR